MSCKRGKKKSRNLEELRGARRRGGKRRRWRRCAAGVCGAYRAIAPSGAGSLGRNCALLDTPVNTHEGGDHVTRREPRDARRPRFEIRTDLAVLGPLLLRVRYLVHYVRRVHSLALSLARVVSRVTIHGNGRMAMRVLTNERRRSSIRPLTHLSTSHAHVFSFGE